MVLDAADHDTWRCGSFFTNPILRPLSSRRSSSRVADRLGPGRPCRRASPTPTATSRRAPPGSSTRRASARARAARARGALDQAHPRRDQPGRRDDVRRRWPRPRGARRGGGGLRRAPRQRARARRRPALTRVRRGGPAGEPRRVPGRCDVPICWTRRTRHPWRGGDCSVTCMGGEARLPPRTRATSSCTRPELGMHRPGVRPPPSGRWRASLAVLGRHRTASAASASVRCRVRRLGRHRRLDGAAEDEGRAVERVQTSTSSSQRRPSRRG